MAATDVTGRPRAILDAWHPHFYSSNVLNQTTTNLDHGTCPVFVSVPKPVGASPSCPRWAASASNLACPSRWRRSACVHQRTKTASGWGSVRKRRASLRWALFWPFSRFLPAFVPFRSWRFQPGPYRGSGGSCLCFLRASCAGSPKENLEENQTALFRSTSLQGQTPSIIPSDCLGSTLSRLLWKVSALPAEQKGEDVPSLDTPCWRRQAVCRCKMRAGISQMVQAADLERDDDEVSKQA